MSAPYGSQNSNNKRLTVYESCQKIFESKELVQQICKSQNENSNFFQTFKQYIEGQQEKMKGNIDVNFRLELQSTLELFVENMDCLLPKIPTVDQDVSEKIPTVDQDVSEKIPTVDQDVSDKIPTIDQDVSEKKTDSRFIKESTETNLGLKNEKLKLFACPKCDAMFEDILKFGLHFKQIHLKNRGGQFVVLKSSEIAAQNSTDKTPTIYECDAKCEEMLESGLNCKQIHLENRAGPCDVLKSSEMADPQEALNSINKRSTVYKCDARFDEIPESDLHFKQNYLENRGGICDILRSSEIADPQKAQNSANKRPTIYECDSKCKEILESGLHFEQNLLENSGDPCVVLKSSEIADLQEAQNSTNKNLWEFYSTNKRPTIYECDVKFEEILESGLHLELNHLENRGGPCGVLKSSEMSDPQEAPNSSNKRPRVYGCVTRFEEIPESDLHFKQNHWENRGGPCGVLKSSEMADPHRIQNSTNKRLSVYESCKKIIEARNQAQKSLSQTNSSDFELRKRVQQIRRTNQRESEKNCKSQNENSILPADYKCDAKFEEIHESGRHLKQNLLENRGGPCGALKSSEMADPQVAQNSTDKRLTVYKCDAKSEEILEPELYFEQNHLENRGGPCGVLKSSEITDPQESQNSTNERSTVYKRDAKSEEILESVLNFEQNHLKSRRGPCGVFKSSEIAVPQVAQNSTNKRPTVYKCDAKSEEILESGLNFEQNHLESRRGSCGVFKSPEMADPQVAQNSTNKRLTVYKCDAKSEEILEPELYFEQNHLENRGGPCGVLKSSEMSDSHGTQNSTNKRLSVYESCIKIIEARNHAQKSLSPQNSNDFELRKSVQQNCKSENKNLFFSQPCKRQQKRKRNLSMKLFTCPNCDEKFERELQKFVLHLRECSAKKRRHLALPVECNLCQIIFHSEKDYAIHLQSHTVASPDQKMNDKEVELQSSMEKILNKSELFAENMNISLEKLPAIDQDISEKETDSRFPEESAETNSWLKSQNLKMYLFACPKCDAKFERGHELVLHLKKNHSEKREHLDIPMECKLCQYKFPSKNDYAIHLCHHAIENQQQKLNDVEVEVQSSIKKILNKSELFAENMNSFLKNLPTIDQDLSEKKADSRFNKESTKKNFELKSQNLNMKLFTCPRCDAKYEGERELVLHFRVNHSNKRGRLSIPVKCRICQNIFPSKRDYVIHFRTHSEKKHLNLSSEKSHLSNVSHSSKNSKDKKPRRSVWDDCKKVLTEKSSLQTSSANPQCVLPKLPISKKVVFMNTSPDEIEFKYFKTPSDKMKVTNFTPFLKENKMVNYSSLNGIDCDSDSAEKLLSESKNLDDLQSDNLVHFKTEAMDLAEDDNLNFSCNVCGSAFKEIEKYEAHYSTHLDEEFCQIREGDEELQVCNVCGGCFTEINTFQAHLLTHVKKELV